MSKEQAIRDAQKEINNLNAAILFMQLLPDFEGALYGTYANCFQSLVIINLPFDYQTYARFRRALGKGWKKGKWLNTQHHGGSIHRHCTFSRDGCKPMLRVSLCTELEGATCHLNQVGVKETPVYEVVCD